MICDFCAATNPAHVIECASFKVVDPPGLELAPMVSESSFMACDTCYGLVIADKRKALLARAKSEFIAKHGQWHPLADAILEDFHAQFWASKYP